MSLKLRRCVKIPERIDFLFARQSCGGFDQLIIQIVHLPKISCFLCIYRTVTCI